MTPSATTPSVSVRALAAGLLIVAALVTPRYPAAQANAGAPLMTEVAKGAVEQPTLKQAPVQMRSAQSDCIREANRRGYSVTDMGNYQQSRDGWSVDMRARDRRGRVAEGSCFVESRTGDASLYGFGWGDDWNGQNSLEFVCASTDSKHRECQIPIDGRVRLVKRISDARCVEGESWGQRGDRLWVDNGCRARFEVTRGGGGAGGIVQCASDNQRYRECALGHGYSARLVREISNDRCRRDSTWGTREGVLWVTNGCRGEFERIRGNGHGNGNGNGNGNRNGNYDDAGGRPGNSATAARNACLDEAQRLGLRIAREYAPQGVAGGYRMQLQLFTSSGDLRNATCSYSNGDGRARIDR